MNCLQKLENITKDTNLDIEYISKLYALEGLLRRAAFLPDMDTMVIRGSLITRAWVLPLYRRVDDLDLMAVYPFDAERGEDFVWRIMQVQMEDGLQIFSEKLQIEPIWENTEFPGRRFLVPVKYASYEFNLQIDLAFNDPLVTVSQ